ncbi:MAG: hypothetical protein ACREQ5_06875 [Candidatus Dormibacteria bacterium]
MSPIEGLSDQRRLTRDFKVRLGVRYKKIQGGRERVSHDPKDRGYPSETDYFVLEEAPDEVQKIYQTEPKSLRIMLPMEWDAVGPTGEDLVWALYNWAYGNQRGLKCRGTGRSIEMPGKATTTDKDWASRIGTATKHAPKVIESTSGTTRYEIKCIGRDCPKFLHRVQVPDPQDPAKTVEQLAPNHDPDASCNEAVILRCFLLHPETNPSATENYCRVLGTMELASTSINTIIDLQSDFDMLRSQFAHRSAGIPMTLIRKPTVTRRPGVQTHYTCKIHFDHREVQRWAAIPLNEVYLSEQQRAIKRLYATPLGQNIDSLRDLIPAQLQPPVDVQNGDADLHGIITGGVYPARGATDQTAATPPSGPPEATAAAVGPPERSDDPSGDPTADSPKLVASQLDQLKWLAGGPEDPTKPVDRVSNPWKQAALDRLIATINAMNEEAGTDVHFFRELTVAHADWLIPRLQSLPPLGETNV